MNDETRNPSRTAGCIIATCPNLSDAINHNLVQSEIEGGVHLRDVAPGTLLEVETENRFYTIAYQGGCEAWISGNPVFCPEPVLVKIHGSTWGGSMLKERFIGRGMHLQFLHPMFKQILTSRIVDVREKSPHFLGADSQSLQL